MNRRPAPWTSLAAVAIDPTGSACSAMGVNDQASTSYRMERTSGGTPWARAWRIASRLVSDRTRFVKPTGRLASGAAITRVRSSANQRLVTVPSLSRRRSDESADAAISQTGLPSCRGSTDEVAPGLAGATVGPEGGGVAEVGGEAPGFEAPGLEALGAQVQAISRSSPRRARQVARVEVGVTD